MLPPQIGVAMVPVLIEFTRKGMACGEVVPVAGVAVAVIYHAGLKVPENVQVPPAGTTTVPI